MKKLFPVIFVFLFACNTNTGVIPILSVSETAAKFNNTSFKNEKTAHGIVDYRDTTYNNTLFKVRDTISYIGTDNQGNDYVVLGRMDGSRPYAVKCYFEDKKELSNLNINQVVIINSTKHFAIVKPVISQELADTMKIMILQMQKCHLASI